MSVSLSAENRKAKVLGFVNFGNQQITYLFDSGFNCNFKTIPHKKDLFSVDETVTLSSTDNDNLFKIENISLAEIVYAVINCDQINFQEKAKAPPQSVTISCAGTCNCALTGSLNSNQDGLGTVSCTCSDCTMSLNFRSSESDDSDNVDNFELLGKSSIEIALLEEYLNYADEQEQALTLTKIEMTSKDDVIVTNFFYKTEGGDLGSVMMMKALGKTYQVSCSGGCDCRAQYSFDTNTASCSCSDCQMTIVEK